MTPGASHLLVLQEDALPVADFTEKFASALIEQPEAVIALFVPGFAYLTKQMEQAKAAGLRFTPMRVGAFIPCVGILYPAALVADILDWVDHGAGDRQRRQFRGADDGIIAQWARHRRIQPLLLVPSIVDHDPTIGSIGKMHRRVGPHRSAAML